jgi:hypothetical protein
MRLSSLPFDFTPFDYAPFDCAQDMQGRPPDKAMGQAGRPKISVTFDRFLPFKAKKSVFRQLLYKAIFEINFLFVKSVKSA